MAAIWGVDLWRATAAAVNSGLGSVLIAPSRSEPLILCRMGETSRLKLRQQTLKTQFPGAARADKDKD